eukprot:TRINITY_DN1589_c2_g1_i1.p1 TRINITY_DN1589_c2_g1~~TRINITY_DN1589_c2_g1_i1.p1  ORF type:complete len:312 (+),score=46.26 TRINITY_DN1589_c2_g1_i1:40-936(+)
MISGFAAAFAFLLAIPAADVCLSSQSLLQRGRDTIEISKHSGTRKKGKGGKGSMLNCASTKSKKKYKAQAPCKWTKGKCSATRGGEGGITVGEEPPARASPPAQASPPLQVSALPGIVPGYFENPQFKFVWCPDLILYRKVEAPGFFTIYTNRQCHLRPMEADGAYPADFEALADAWQPGTPELAAEFAEACPSAGFQPSDAANMTRRLIPPACYGSQHPHFGSLTLGHTNECRTFHETIRFDVNGTLKLADEIRGTCTAELRSTNFSEAGMEVKRIRDLTPDELLKCSQNLGTDFWQ